MPATAQRHIRAKGAHAALGPLGWLMASKTTARVLEVLTAQPTRHFRLSDFEAQAHVARRSLTGCLQTLEKARLLRKEGRGPQVRYRYALEDPFALAFSVAVGQSRSAAAPPKPQTLADSLTDWLSMSRRSYSIGEPQLDSGEELVSETQRIADMKQLTRAESGATPSLRRGGSAAI